MNMVRSRVSAKPSTAISATTANAMSARLKVASTDAVRLIKEAGGTAILAHPLLYGLSNTNLQKMIDELKPVGLDGLEAIYSTYTTGEEQQMKRLARENGLLISGGSDFHGSNKPDIALGRGRGHLYIPYSVLETIKPADKKGSLHINGKLLFFIK